jgi:hypothetical protein
MPESRLALVATTVHLSSAAWLLVGSIGAVSLAIVVWAIIDIARRPYVTGGRKWVWVIVALLAEPIGAIIYLALGRAEPPAADALHRDAGKTQQRATATADVLYGPQGAPMPQRAPAPAADPTAREPGRTAPELRPPAQRLDQEVRPEQAVQPGGDPRGS